MTDYPQHDKLQKVRDDSQTIGLFLERFFSEYDVYPKGTVSEFVEQAEGFKGFTEALAGSDIEVEYPRQVLGGEPGVNRILADYYDIDYEELMAEKDRMLADIRAQNATPTGGKA